MPTEQQSSSARLVRQLTSVDASFLAMEDARTFAHVCGLCILDPSTAPGGTFTLSDALELIEQRLHLLPPFRWRLAKVPLGLDHPYWAVDPDFDLEFHVRELALPAPGDNEQLAAQVERLVARPLDRSRPLWELYLIQGLSGDRMALLTKMHHALIDGVSGAEILGVLFDTDPEGRELPPRTEGDDMDRLPASLELVARAAFNWPVRAASAARGISRTLPKLEGFPTVDDIPGASMVGRMIGRSVSPGSRDRDGEVVEHPSTRPPRTSLNGSISAHRKFSFGSIPLDTVKQVKNEYGVTVNDVIVALSAGAVREFLIRHDDLPSEPLVAMIPISTRKPDEKGTYGNRVSAMIVPIPTDEPDPVERLRRTHSELARAKEKLGALPADLLTDVTNFVPPALFARATRATTRLGTSQRFSPLFNLTVSNVPGPPVQLYVGGARLESNYPVSVITDGVALNITVLSYRDQVDFGVVADRELAPDLDLILDTVRADLKKLEEMAPETAGR
ncbi:MAG: wax ester/triacylglycerol synthase family O-acyltransferase [Thermoleophilia bacterium]|nr:wax ester/triacylglycerol synthase family O-acyltransferase [Thermoleophilia bacterium]